MADQHGLVERACHVVKDTVVRIEKAGPNLAGPAGLKLIWLFKSSARAARNETADRADPAEPFDG
jgi:hypothetical protein